MQFNVRILKGFYLVAVGDAHGPTQPIVPDPEKVVILALLSDAFRVGFFFISLTGGGAPGH